MPKRVDSEKRRARLAGAARAVMLDEGAHALSISKVADRADLAKATVFEAFAGRDALLDEVYRLVPDGPDAEHPDPITAVLEWAASRVRGRAADFRALQLAEAGRRSGERAERLRDGLEAEERVLADFLRRAMERGRIASLPPSRTAAMLMAGIDGTACRSAARRLDGPDLEDRISDLCGAWRNRLEGRR